MYHNPTPVGSGVGHDDRAGLLGGCEGDEGREPLPHRDVDRHAVRVHATRHGSLPDQLDRPLPESQITRLRSSSGRGHDGCQRLDAASDEQCHHELISGSAHTREVPHTRVPILRRPQDRHHGTTHAEPPAALLERGSSPLDRTEGRPRERRWPASCYSSRSSKLSQRTPADRSPRPSRLLRWSHALTDPSVHRATCHRRSSVAPPRGTSSSSITIG